MTTPQAQHRMHHRVLIVGGGTAGITVAARLRRAGAADIGLIEPSETHYYQPLWTLVGGGRAGAAESARPQRKVIPKGVAWTKAAAEAVDPDLQVVTTDTGVEISYDYLVMAPGIQLDWEKVPGMAEALRSPFVSSNYSIDFAPKTWDRIRQLRSGTAVFTQPAGLIKCAGAPQKIAYLAADHWRREGVLGDIDIHLILPTPGLFGVKVFADELERAAQRYGISVHTNSEVVEVDAAGRRAVVTEHSSGAQQALGYDFLHVVPPQSAPDWVKRSALVDPQNPAGYIEIDKHTLQHVRYPNVFALGDAGSTPNSKTGAAIRKQAPSSSATCSPPWPAGRRATSTTGTPPVRSPPPGTRCCSPSSTTPCSRTPPSRSSTPPRSARTCGCSSGTASPPSTGT